MNMRSVAVLLLLAVSGTLVLAQATTAPATSTAPATALASAFKTENERMGYAVGLQIGTNLKGIDIDAATLAQGIHDAAAGSKPLMTDAEVEDSLTTLKKQVMAKADADAAAAGDANKKAGDAFLVENGKKDGVKTTASGLEYKVIKSGTGKSPKATDTVSVNYRGTLITGKEFDASNGTPVEFPVNRVIPGWTEALQLMKVGDKWEIVIPAKLAYGDNPPPGAPIGPNEVLVFEVELLAVK